MTSVQSPRQPLNGNNMWAIFLTLILVGMSCRTQTVLTTASVEQSIPIQKKDSIPDYVVPDKKLDFIEERHPLDPGRIAIVLPFQTEVDSIRYNPSQSPSKAAHEIYAGILFALDSLQKLGLPVHVEVYDSKNDPISIKSITAHWKEKKPDIILGPVFNNELKEMAAWAKQNKVLLISPLSPASHLTNENSFYLMVHPDLDMHIKKIFNYLTTHFAYGDKMIVYYRPDSDEDDLKDLLQHLAGEYRDQNSKFYFQIEEVIYSVQEEFKNKHLYNNPEKANLKASLSTTGKNYIIVPTYDRSFIQMMTREFQSFTETYDITLLGTPAWEEHEQLNLEYVDNLDVFYTAPHYVDTSFYQKHPLAIYYNSEFETDPPLNTVKGFDLMMYASKLLLERDKLSQPENIDFTFNGISLRLHAVPVYERDSISYIGNKGNNSKKLLYLQNEAIQILHYSNGKLVQVE